jgi:hypothetical protein
VVAERDDVRAGGEQPLGDPRGDAGAVGGVLAVDDAEVDGELVAKIGQPFLDRPPSGDAKDVCDEEDPQLVPRH